jgi:hypothetical protein
MYMGGSGIVILYDTAMSYSTNVSFLSNIVEPEEVLLTGRTSFAPLIFKAAKTLERLPLDLSLEVYLGHG